MNLNRLVLVFLAALAAARLALIGQFQLFPDESYYYMWSERMDWSFFSKGPGVASTMWISTHLFGATEFGVRFFSPLLSLGTSLLAWTLARRLFGESVAAWTVITMNVLPIFNVGSVVLTIDPLSIFFWMAALCTIWRALEAAPRWTWWWPFTGLLVGLGFLAKYTNAMQLLSIALLLAITTRHRGEFRRPGLYSLLGVFLLCCTPVLVWNAQHDWITLDHLTARGGLKKPFALHPTELLQFIGMHFGVYSPLIFASIAIAAVWAWPRARHSFKTRFLLVFGLPLFALYFWLSLKQSGEANWTAPGAISLTLLAVALWHERAQESAWIRKFAIAALALGGIMSLLILNTDLARMAGIPWPYKNDPGHRMRDWQHTAAKIEQLRAEIEAELEEPIFLIANEHEVAASLAFYMKAKRPEGPAHPPVYIPAQPYFEDQFSFWPRYDQLLDLPPDYVRENAIFTEEQGYNPFKGRTALYITDREENNAPSSIKKGFEKWQMIRCIDQQRRGMPLRQIRVFLCENFLDPGVE